MTKNVAQTGDNSIIVQAGRDAVLKIEKSPPDIKLVRLTIEEDEEHGCLRQKLNIILKNNGDRSAFLLRGSLQALRSETITLCNEIGMQHSLSTADWTYDVDISEPTPEFVGHHSIAPNEVVNFDLMVGRKEGGHAPTVYECIIEFEFDEGKALRTEPFHIMIAGPIVWNGGFRAQGPSVKQWGKCQADNITRLRAIGFDYRDYIDEGSRQYVETAAPGIFDDDNGDKA